MSQTIDWAPGNPRTERERVLRDEITREVNECRALGCSAEDMISRLIRANAQLREQTELKK